MRAKHRLNVSLLTFPHKLRSLQGQHKHTTKSLDPYSGMGLMTPIPDTDATHIEELQCTLKLPLGMPLGALPQHLLLTSTRISKFCHYQFQMEFTSQQIFTSTPLMQTEQTPFLPLSTDNTFDSFSTPLPLNTSTPPSPLGRYSFSPYWVLGAPNKQTNFIEKIYIIWYNGNNPHQIPSNLTKVTFNIL